MLRMQLRASGQFAWAHFLALDEDRRLYIADVLNWRFQVFAPTEISGKFEICPDRQQILGFNAKHRMVQPSERSPA
jgi:hypothetical protein